MLVTNTIEKSVHRIETYYFDIVAGMPQGNTLAPNLFIIYLDYVLRTSIDLMKKKRFQGNKGKKSRRYPARTIADVNYADDLALLANTPAQAETMLHSLKRASGGMGININADKTENMCFNQRREICTQRDDPLKLVDKFTYLGSSVSQPRKTTTRD